MFMSKAPTFQLALFYTYPCVLYEMSDADGQKERIGRVKVEC